MDSTGTVIKTNQVKASDNEIHDAVKSMSGPQMQIPPMFSAVSVGGKRLYELARKGIEIEREPRNINVLSIDVLYVEKPKVVFDIKCTKGTYVRKICSDIGDKLGCGGCMSFLLRLSTGLFKLENSVTIEKLELLSSMNRLDEALLPVSDYLCGYNSVILSENDQRKFVNGAVLFISELSPEVKDANVLVFDESGSLLGFTNDMRSAGNGLTLIGRRNVLV
jgi:tRNA pseudouridine55 synthase